MFLTSHETSIIQRKKQFIIEIRSVELLQLKHEEKIDEIIA